MSYRSWSWTILAALVMLLSQGRPTRARTHYIFMTSYCGTEVHVDGSIVLSLTDVETLPQDRESDFTHCDLALVAPPGKKLFAHFLQLGISPSGEHSDRLQIFDSIPNNTRLTPIMGLYGMLDRALSLTDESGIKVKDYRSNSNQMKLDYLGKPTKKSNGFRILVTSFQEPNYGGSCPDRHYLCRQARICIPNHVVCDGKPNCGKSDEGDEKGCDRYDTVTSLLAKYSLARDIVVVILLPLAFFVAFVVIIVLLAHRHIRLKLTKQAPAVHYTPQRNEQVEISESRDKLAPPSYEELHELYSPLPVYRESSSPLLNDCSDLHASKIEAAMIYADRRGSSKKHLLETRAVSFSTDDKNSSTKEDLEKSEDESYRLQYLRDSNIVDDADDINAKCRGKGDRGKMKGNGKESNKPEVHHGVLNSPSAPEDLSLGKSYVPSNDTEFPSPATDLSCPDSSSTEVSPDSDSYSVEEYTAESIIEH